MDLEGPARVIAYVFGGQGTMNVPSWSPDSRMLAFVAIRPAIDRETGLTQRRKVAKIVVIEPLRLSAFA